jgi:hypothetical protein
MDRFTKLLKGDRMKGSTKMKLEGKVAIITGAGRGGGCPDPLLTKSDRGGRGRPEGQGNGTKSTTRSG